MPAPPASTWGAECEVMRGEIAADRVRVSRGGDTYRSGRFIKTVVIDRRLGTYSERSEVSRDGIAPGLVSSTGVCQRRETF